MTPSSTPLMPHMFTPHLWYVLEVCDVGLLCYVIVMIGPCDLMVRAWICRGSPLDEAPSTTSTSPPPLPHMFLLYLWHYLWQVLGVSGDWLLCYVMQAEGAAPDSWEERVP